MKNSIVLEMVDCLKNHPSLKHCKIESGFENEVKPTRLKKIRIVVFLKKEKLALPLASGEIVSTQDISVSVFLPYTMNSDDCDVTFALIKQCLVLSKKFLISSMIIEKMKRDSSVDIYVANSVLTVVEVFDCE